MPKMFYRAVDYITEGGITITFFEYEVLYETDHTYFCVDTMDKGRLEYVLNADDGRTGLVKLCKKYHIDTKRIFKNGSRIAFPSKQDAIKNLRYRRQLQIGHLRRQMENARLILEKTENMTIDDDQREIYLRGTRDFVMGNYQFS